MFKLNEGLRAQAVIQFNQQDFFRKMLRKVQIVLVFQYHRFQNIYTLLFFTVSFILDVRPLTGQSILEIG